MLLRCPGGPWRWPRRSCRPSGGACRASGSGRGRRAARSSSSRRDGRLARSSWSRLDLSVDLRDLPGVWRVVARRAAQLSRLPALEPTQALSSPLAVACQRIDLLDHVPGLQRVVVATPGSLRRRSSSPGRPGPARGSASGDAGRAATVGRRPQPSSQSSSTSTFSTPAPVVSRLAAHVQRRPSCPELVTLAPVVRPTAGAGTAAAPGRAYRPRRLSACRRASVTLTASIRSPLTCLCRCRSACSGRPRRPASRCARR